MKRYKALRSNSACGGRSDRTLKNTAHNNKQDKGGNYVNITSEGKDYAFL
ncbi:hypothetical protein ACEYW6_09770 [Nostoc sp. UIC 10607]|nr:hypothetical protein [Nostoc sp. 2RC]MBC1236834.1 hypothetical protein [Nostoc sp. 2RC]